jgi:CDP-2,3-bis-(O-geranylgeranyl)-sn-glycerol synthase
VRDLDAPWVFLPLIGSLLAHAPVIRFDVMKGLKHPIDGGRTLRGRRILGDNKTWRGFFTMAAGVFVAALLLSRWSWYWGKLPDEIRSAGPAVFGVLLGLGTVLAELPGSFLKRQLDIPPGAQRLSAAGVLLSVWDQGDFVLGAWLLLAPVWMMPVRQVVLSFVVVAIVHLLVSVVGKALGVRRTAL